MTIPRRSWRGAGAFAAAAVVGLAGGVLSASPAAAHTPTWAVTCSEVTLNLTAYSGNATNEVTVSVVGGDDLLATTKFGREYSTKTPLQLPEHDKELTVRLVVKAGDDDKYSFNDTKTAPVCEDDTPSPTPTEATPSEAPSTEPPASETPEPSATPSETATEAAPAPAEPSSSAPDLAETGSSSATPVIGGAAVAVLLAGGGILWSVRKRRTAQH
ncbi:LPXTG cell wall anchor domain-containing protein [Streptomyces sp. NE06-03E]|uniref:LPXTG cell wall anchor domain-containing protein n=2 Tax=Streptomyces TaxID=1883 RepID=A0A652KPH6_9ACTN|nr:MULTISPECIES: LAETG motif-containing sortase-dependent surface protein [unclassified Streptomyces]WSS66075.1 LPXTG cell wall anchor domain-containing protein [Streptomyces sp. NBC_01177]WSS73070.1 LPXTG cell wall anchor domain-containing protein [Streptomyces sp. NBC_01175]WSS80112.1 LPXTG cell wall anchor domain-containing protein [Streptomyces sp. NBC_01174]MDX3057573.1 LPXTG cell wall anchor domain-containing protein [Streptomyces sp. NE06-03E]MDX3328459.1 LPXTG cell wall anchor domain-c